MTTIFLVLLAIPLTVGLGWIAWLFMVSWWEMLKERICRP